MPYSITSFKSEKVTKGGNVETYETFEDLANRFNNYKVDQKLGSGWVRGKLDPPERNDSCRTNSNLLIIDGDVAADGTNAPNPSTVHNILKGNDINHFIYTSHSHSVEKNKFRCVVPTNVPYTTNEQLRNEISRILKILGDAGYGIKFVKEMKAWSQIWFDPRRSEHDGLFEFYFYDQGEDWNVQESTQATEETSREESTQSGDSETLDKLLENIRTGEEYHESLRTLSFQYVKDGMSKANAKAILKAFMNASSDAGSERWTIRYEEIDRLVDGVKDDLDADFNMESIDIKYIPGQIPRPPGMFGRLEQACYESLLYKYREVSIVTTIGLIAGICGRKFNVVTTDRMGLNMYLTLIANTGVGKDGINKFINRTIRSATKTAGEAIDDRYTSFIGPASFTGPKAIYNAFENSRSMVCVSSEQGLLLQSKSGDTAGKQSMILNMFNDSGSDVYTRSAYFSEKEKNIEPLRAVAATFISESTPTVLMEAYSGMGALDMGLLPRQMIFKIEKRTRMSRDKKNNLPEDIVDRLHDLLEVCAEVQASDDPQAYDMVFSDDTYDDVFNYVDMYDDISDDNVGVDHIKAQMATRVNIKAIRLAAIATVINKRKHDPRALIIDKPEWEWAKAICDYEFNNVSNALTLGAISGNSDMDAAVAAVYVKLFAIVDNTINSDRCKVDIRYQRQKLVPYSKLKIACSKHPAINKINDKHGRMIQGLDKVLDYMKESKVIQILDKDPLQGRSPKIIKVLSGIVDFIKPYGVNV